MDSSRRGSGIRIEYAKQKMGAVSNYVCVCVCGVLHVCLCVHVFYSVVLWTCLQPSRSSCMSTPTQAISYLHGSVHLPGEGTYCHMNGFVDESDDSSRPAMNGNLSDNDSLEI